MTKLVYVNSDVPARSFSFMWFKRIYLTSAFFTLKPDEATAVLLHEQGHCRGHHTEWRMLCLLLCPFLLRRLCHWQEYQADAYAQRAGYGIALSRLLSYDDKPWPFHPPNSLRRQKLIHNEFSESPTSRAHRYSA
jgi:Zn-dependent protease with chaperone function